MNNPADPAPDVARVLELLRDEVAFRVQREDERV